MSPQDQGHELRKPENTSHGSVPPCLRRWTEDLRHDGRSPWSCWAKEAQTRSSISAVATWSVAGDLAVSLRLSYPVAVRRGIGPGRVGHLPA